MAGLAGPEIAAAVSNKGGLGHLGALRVPPHVLREWIAQTRDLTDRPFGVNLVPQYGGPDVFEAAVQVALEAKPKVVSFFYGDFADTIPRFKDAGIVTSVQVGSLAEAKKAAEDGADLIVAQGIESGGHIRGRVSLMALVPAVVDAVSPIPVVAAGAINDARGVRAALCLGAQGVWCGTAFLVSSECNTNDAYKQKLVEADTDAPQFLTGYSYGWKFGTPHRAILGCGGWNLLRFMGGGLRRVDKPGLADRISLYAGQGVGLIDRISGVDDVFDTLAAGFVKEEALC